MEYIARGLMVDLFNLVLIYQSIIMRLRILERMVLSKYKVRDGIKNIIFPYNDFKTTTCVIYFDSTLMNIKMK